MSEKHKCPSCRMRELIDDGQDFAKIRKQMQDVLEIQCDDGNWDFDPYMHGMANGMILMVAIFDGVDPRYLDAPKVWRKTEDRMAAATTSMKHWSAMHPTIFQEIFDEAFEEKR